MIQFNLLPDVKLEYIKARRNKRLTILTASGVACASIAVLVLLFLVVNVFQKRYLNDLSNDIAEASTKLQETEGINDILTVQSQLRSLPEVHGSKPVSSRLFSYIKQLTPTNVSIAKLDVDFEESTIKITGSASSLGSVYKFIDTMKFATYESKDSSGPAFSGVVLTNSGRDTKGASYVIDLSFDPVIFRNSSDIKLIIPEDFITTRSQVDSKLFEPLSNPEANQGAEE